jgi:Zn-dependent hydrolases, including glyoxylases
MKKVIILVFTILFMGNLLVTAQQKNTFTYKVGDYELILLSEGQNEGSPKILIGATPEMIKKAMPNGNYPSAVNAFLIKMPDKNILVDTGHGRNLFANLKSVGVAPEDIHTLIITHMHGDHIGGMLKDGKILFPNAKVQIGEVERNYWVSEKEMNKLPENRRGSFQSAQNVLKAYADKLEIVRLTDIEAKKGDGVFFIKAYGHTPGHTACLIQSGESKLLIWADLTHVMAIQMQHPEIAVTYDVNPEQAIKSRKQILEFVAKYGIPVAGMHIPYPGIGKIESSGQGYKFTPAL